MATLRHRRQKTKESRDCSEMEAVKPPVDIKTVCQRLDVAEGGGEVVVGGGNVVPLGDFSGAGEE